MNKELCDIIFRYFRHLFKDTHNRARLSGGPVVLIEILLNSTDFLGENTDLRLLRESADEGLGLSSLFDIIASIDGVLCQKGFIRKLLKALSDEVERVCRFDVNENLKVVDVGTALDVENRKSKTGHRCDTLDCGNYGFILLIDTKAMYSNHKEITVLGSIHVDQESKSKKIITIHFEEFISGGGM